MKNLGLFTIVMFYLFSTNSQAELTGALRENYIASVNGCINSAGGEQYRPACSCLINETAKTLTNKSLTKAMEYQKKYGDLPDDFKQLSYEKFEVCKAKLAPKPISTEEEIMGMYQNGCTLYRQAKQTCATAGDYKQCMKIKGPPMFDDSTCPF